MSKLGSDEEFLRLAAEQAKAYLPTSAKPKKASGRKRRSGGRVAYSDPSFFMRMMLGNLAHCTAARDLLFIYLKQFCASSKSKPLLKFLRIRPKPLRHLMKVFEKAVLAKDADAIQLIAESVRMFAKNDLVFNNPRKLILALAFEKLAKSTKPNPRPADIVAEVRQQYPAMFGNVLNESLFRDIAEMGLRSPALKANKKKKKR